ncbi:sterol desaturase family protein [Oligoflexus tunisiensis]|uniref:sterol desaturase family protein n=1 Tax=Oligoflexus tunisiensis TaxID=708132 RepID=UPI00159F263E|nr:sterol desaturase family protein [Oligoflexus tunisiensis]
MSQFESGSLNQVLETTMLPDLKLADWPLAFLKQYINHNAEMLFYFMIAFGLCALMSRRKIYRISVTKQQYKNEFKQALLILLADSVTSFFLLRTGIVHFSVTSITQDAVVFIGHFAFFEIWFYAAHRLMHKKSFFRFHAIHHRSRVTTPLSVLHQSVFERSFLTIGFVLPIMLSSSLNSLSPITMFVLIAVNSMGSIMQHVNFEWLIRMSRGKRIALIMHSAASHSLHHARIEGNYGFLTSVMDRLFGTYIEDTELVSEKAWKGEGLTRLLQVVTEPDLESKAGPGIQKTS